MFKYTVSSWHTHYQLLGALGLEGFRSWLQLVTCTYLLLSPSIHAGGGQCLRFEQPKGDECRVECKAFWRSELRTRMTSD